jgi:vancomycin resistance protein YoaR
MSDLLFLPAPQKQPANNRRRAFGLGFLALALGGIMVFSFSSNTEILANIVVQNPTPSESVPGSEIALIEQKNHSLVRIMVDQKDYGMNPLKDLGLTLSLANPVPEDSHFIFQTSNAQETAATTTVEVTLDHKVWNSFLNGVRSTFEKPSLKPRILWTPEAGWTKEEGQAGMMIVQTGLKEKLTQLVTDVQSGTSQIVLNLETSVQKELVSPAEKRKLSLTYQSIQKLVSEPLVLQIKDSTFKLDLNSEEDSLVFADNTAHINEAKLRTWVEGIVAENSRPASTVKIIGKDEVRAGIFKAVLDGEFVEGVRINTDEVMDQIKSSLENGEHVVQVKTYEIPVKVHSELENMDYELLSVGYSEFSTGNAPNRVHNVKTGLDRTNGILVDPGKEISFNKSVGNIDSQFRIGYGIFGSAALPVLGGGICQASTTFYRALLNLGVPIHQRQNHSWDLSYYQAGGYGLDATIYPELGLDVKAVNDLSSQLLFYSYIRPETEEAFVLVYGKGDGRKVTLTPEKDYVPFKGAKTLKWKQTVEMPTGEIRENEIVSRYRA